MKLTMDFSRCFRLKFWQGNRFPDIHFPFYITTTQSKRHWLKVDTLEVYQTNKLQSCGIETIKLGYSIRCKNVYDILL